MKNNRKRWMGIAVLTLGLSACSDAVNFDAVSENIPKSEEKVQEVMEPTVQVHSVAGSTDGVVFQVDERSKWIVTEASVFREHPKALIVTSTGQQLEGVLVAFDVAQNEAIVHMRNSAKVEPIEQDNQSQLEAMLEQKLTADERYTLHAAFSAEAVPQKYGTERIQNYEKETFDYNPDALQAFVTTFNEAYNRYVATKDIEELKTLVLADLLVESLQQQDKPRYIQQFQVTAVTKAGFEWVVKGKSDGIGVTYKVNKVNGQYYISYFMMEQE